MSSAGRMRCLGTRAGRFRREAAFLALLGLLLTACGGGTPATAAPVAAEPTASATPEVSPSAPPPLPTASPTPRSLIGADNATNLVVLDTLSGHSAAVTALAYAPDGSWLASASQDAAIRLWPARGGQAARRLEGHTDGVWSLAFSPDGLRLVSGSDDRTVRVWELPAGRLIDTLRSSSLGRVLQVAYAPDGLWIAAGDQFCLVQVRSARTGVLYRSLIQPGCSPVGGNIVETWGLAFTPDSTRLLTAEAQSCCGGTVQAWGLEDYTVPQRVQGPNGGVRSLALSPDGETLALAFASNATTWVVQTDSGEVLHQLRGHGYAVRDLAISPDGRSLATASADRTVRLWDLPSGELLATLEGHQAAVNSLAFSPDGSRLASGDDAGVILIWGIGPPTSEVP